MMSKSDQRPIETLRPWYRPGKWLVNPEYWAEESLQQRKDAPPRVHFIDCTLSEGDDCVGHQLNWNTRLELIERLDAIGVSEITLPSHATYLRCRLSSDTTITSASAQHHER